MCVCKSHFDVLEQVAARCPLIPSRSWLSLKFWPKNAHAQGRVQYIGRFKVKYRKLGKSCKRTSASVFTHAQKFETRTAVLYPGH